MPKRKRQHPHAHLLRLLEAVNVPQLNECPGQMTQALLGQT
jgi:hypothetical protein